MQEHVKMSSNAPMMKIENFGDMQARYQGMALDGRAMVVISDSELALAVAHKNLEKLGANMKLPQAIASLRANDPMISRIRHCEAKERLMDDSVDFVRATIEKLSQWHQTLEHIAKGKTKATLVKEGFSEHHCVAGGSGYLALVKLIISELSRLDSQNQETYNTMLAEMRRCATIISDCECASELNSVVIH